MNTTDKGFTPGPWLIRPLGDRFLTIENEHGEEAVTVITSNYVGKETKDGWTRDVYTPVPRAEANAKLIAAAPDLLKLLREVLEWNEDDADLASNDTAFRLQNFADTVANRSAALRAVIAKATGAETVPAEAAAAE